MRFCFHSLIFTILFLFLSLRLNLSHIDTLRIQLKDRLFRQTVSICAIIKRTSFISKTITMLVITMPT